MQIMMISSHEGPVKAHLVSSLFIEEELPNEKLKLCLTSEWLLIMKSF